MSVQTIQFDAVGPIPLFPDSVSVLDRAKKDILSEQPSAGGPSSNVVIPQDAIITEIIFKRAIDPSQKLGDGSIDWAAQTMVTPGAIIKLGIVTDETKYMPIVSAVTDELNIYEYIKFEPDPILIQRPDVVPPTGTINDVVLTAGFADVTAGAITVIIKYKTELVGALGGRTNTTTIL